MSLPDADETLITEELGRELTTAEAALFENLWSEHCAYRSSQPLLDAFEADGKQVVVGPGDDAAVVALPTPEAATTPARHRDASDYTETYVTFGIESHNHPSYVDPYDGAATGVGGIVRDTLSMGAYPIGLADSLYFGSFDADHSRYLFDGVVEGIADYGNAIGVPTVAGSVAFHPGYDGNPLVNVACVGLTDADRVVTADAQRPGNALVLIGNATGRDGLGGASFASEDLSEDAKTEDRPAVQVGDPYSEKLLIECNESIVEEGLAVSARDLGAAGLGGASSEMVAKGGLGAHIELEQVHQREPAMNATEILLAESQERMCYEIRPADVSRVEALADRFDLGCSVIGEVTEGEYLCTYEGESVVEVPAEFLADGAPMNDLPTQDPAQKPRELPSVDLEVAIREVVGSPNTASKEWVYRQYDHEVGLRTAVEPGEDASLLAIREVAEDLTDTTANEHGSPTAGVGLALSAGAEPNWTSSNPYEGARAITIENATNLAVSGAVPLAAVNCLNGGNPEKPTVYDGFSAIVSGLADACSALDIPVVGGNVSLYNDSTTGPIPPTPTLAVLGSKSGYETPPTALVQEPESTLLGIGPEETSLGGSEYLSRCGGSDTFPAPSESPRRTLETLATVANSDHTLAAHDVSHGGLLVTLAEMVTTETGLDVTLPDRVAAFGETPGRAVIQTVNPGAVRDAFEDVAPVTRLGTPDDTGRLRLSVGDEVAEAGADQISEWRSVIDREID